MKTTILTLVAALSLVSVQARAQGSSSSAYTSASNSAYLSTVYNPKFPSWFRLGGLVGGGAAPGAKMEGDGGASAAYFGALLGGIGNGMFTFESGLSYLHQTSSPAINDGGAFRHSNDPVDTDYIGIPLWAKYNYIEKPLAAFYVKAGAMPMFLVNQTDAETQLLDGSTAKIKVAGQDVLAVAGFGGTAPLTNSAAFMLDFMYFYGTMETTEGGVHNQGALASLGVSFDL